MSLYIINEISVPVGSAAVAKQLLEFRLFRTNSFFYSFWLAKSHPYWSQWARFLLRTELPMVWHCCRLHMLNLGIVRGLSQSGSGSAPWWVTDLQPPCCHASRLKQPRCEVWITAIVFVDRFKDSIEIFQAFSCPESRLVLPYWECQAGLASLGAVSSIQSRGGAVWLLDQLHCINILKIDRISFSKVR